MDDKIPFGHQVKENDRDLKQRTKRFALRIIKLAGNLPGTQTARVIGYHLFRSETSVPANYRSACRGRSNADFIAKVGIVEEETDESELWIEMPVDSGLVKENLVSDLLDEGNQLTAIWVTSTNTVRGGKRWFRIPHLSYVGLL